jgi:hypothetical protein
MGGRLGRGASVRRSLCLHWLHLYSIQGLGSQFAAELLTATHARCSSVPAVGPRTDAHYTPALMCCRGPSIHPSITIQTSADGQVQPLDVALSEGHSTGLQGHYRLRH